MASAFLGAAVASMVTPFSLASCHVSKYGASTALGGSSSPIVLNQTRGEASFEWWAV